LHVPRAFRVTLLAAALALPTLAFSSGAVFAYGHADQPLAQVEISGNCDNPSVPFCSDVVGIGGIWVWVEIDSGGTGDVAGAVCEHSVGGPRGGAASIKGEISWSYASGAEVQQMGLALPDITDPTDRYYVMPALEFAVPVTDGHYSFHLAPGVTLQIQVAP
jgi:hypothetical protein